MRMWTHLHAPFRGERRRPHMIEEDERANETTCARRQNASDIETVDVAGAALDDSLDRRRRVTPLASHATRAAPRYVGP